VASLSHLVRNLSCKHIKLFFWLEVSWGELWVISILTKGKNTFRSTLAVNSNLSGVISNISDQNHHLLFLTEWDTHNFVGPSVSIDKHLVGIDIVIEEEFNHSDFKCLSLWFISQFIFISFKSNISVSNDSFSNKILHWIYNFKRSWERFSHVLLNLSITELVTINCH